VKIFVWKLVKTTWPNHAEISGEVHAKFINNIMVTGVANIKNISEEFSIKK
jgi:hypothetical protein